MRSQRSSTRMKKVAAGLMACTAAVLLFRSDNGGIGEGRAEELWKGEKQQLRALAAGAAGTDDDEGQDGKRNSNDTSTSSSLRSSRRPVMHTFYHFVEGTGMSGFARNTLLEAWEEAWRSAGWDTRILTLEDAKAHDSYDRYRAYMDEFGHTKDNEYDAMCFWRWLAMAHVLEEDGSDGGGWMADFDTFPMGADFTHRVGSDLPNGGKLTVHQAVVPALVSGTKSEWDRVGRLLIDTMKEMDMADSENEYFWSDMMALLAVKKTTPEKFVRQEPWPVVPPAWVAADAKPRSEGGCTLWDRPVVALHCSHNDIRKGEKSGLFDDMIKEGKLNKNLRIMDQRTVICKELVDRWEGACGDDSRKWEAGEHAAAASTV